MKTSTKLVVLTGVAAAATITVGAFGYASTVSIVNDSQSIIQHDLLTPFGESSDVQGRLDAATLLLLNADRDAYQSTLALAEGIAGRNIADVEATFYENAAQVKDRVLQALETVSESVPTGYAARFDAAYKAWMSTSEPVLHSLLNGEKVEPDRYQTSIENFEALRGLIDELSESFEIKLATVREQVQALQTTGRDQAEALSRRAHTQQAWTLGIGVASIVLLAGMAVPLVTSVTRRLSNLSRAMSEIASGEADLTRRIQDKGSDEIAGLAHSFDAVIGRLEEFVVRVRGVAEAVAQTTAGVAQVADDTGARINDQNSSVRRVAAAVAEFSASIDQVAGSCEHATGTASEATSLAGEGRGVAGNTVEAISQARTTFEEGVASVEALGERVSQISSIISVINDIADQTNLLALNAAIEAARAGENGRGFAVVADEVRKLADRTTSATDEIVSSIREIEQGTRESVTRLESGRSSMTHGAEQASSAGQALQRIEDSTKTVAGQIEGIYAATREQASATREIAEQTETMSDVASAIDNGARGLKEQVQGLCSAQEELLDLVARYRTSASL